MSFYTSLTGLNAATSQLSVTSNNIANVGTTGFKRSRADFGDIFATSPLQKASSTVGQGVSLKQVTQEFSQGNVTSSSNALDLAITGDGFFPMRSADGLQDIYTRNGSFMLNDQFNVVNSAGQRLMSSTVDSAGNANVNERMVLTIPQKTSGEAKQTSLVGLGLNFPAEAQVISSSFNRADPSTYNKSTAMTVYDNGGNGYLATIYYVKTQNANQSSPYNKWQTYVFVGDDQVNASLVQATNTGGEAIYVNQYGQVKPYSQVKDELTTAKTQLISLDELTDVRTSVPATIQSTKAIDSAFDLSTGVNFSTLSSTLQTQLAQTAFTINVDGSDTDLTVNLGHLTSINKNLTGSDVANELTNYINRYYGDEAYYDLSTASNRKISITSTNNKSSTSPFAPVTQQIELFADDIAANASVDLSKKNTEQVLAELQERLDALNTSNTSAGTPTAYTAQYNYNTRNFLITDGTATLTLAAGSGTVENALFGLSSIPVTLDESGSYNTQVLANGDAMRLKNDQRYGITVSYDATSNSFAFKSGTTGDQSSIALSVNAGSIGEKLLGLETKSVLTSTEAVRGVASQPAVAYGSTPTINVNNNFSVDDSNKTFVVTVDGIKGTVVIPPRADYTVASFTAALEKGINSLGNNSSQDGGMPEMVGGVKVNYDQINNRFVFTTGTASSDSFIKISGSANWGLEEVEAGRGTTATWIKPTQHKELVGGQLVPKYIDSQGNETTSADGFTTLPAWSPVYLDKGELTFDTGGKLVSPKQGTQLETVYLAGGKGALTINIDYSASTQYSSSFAVLSQSQDGAPEGDLVGVTIGNDGLVSASYSNGTQKSLAKILLVNFSSPTGLRQMGDSSFVATAASGQPILGTAGTSGLGTIRAGATESSNVDLTSELVNLITAQRNFQANAKAIETSTTMTQAIINIRG